jgi:hypothetical protein
MLGDLGNPLALDIALLVDNIVERRCTSLKPKVKKNTPLYPRKSIFLDDWVSRITMRFRPPPS